MQEDERTILAMDNRYANTPKFYKKFEILRYTFILHALT